MRVSHISLQSSTRSMVMLFALAFAGCFDDAKPDEDAGQAAGSGGTGGAAGLGGVGGTSGSGTGGSAGTGGTGGSTAGAGGTSGVGGVGGSGGSGGSVFDGGSACTPCIGETLSWGHNGGFVAFTEASELAACNAYRHTRQPAGDPSQVSIECGRGMPCMGSGLHGVSDVLDALAHPDVEAARSQGMVLFGVDTRPLDGSVFRIVLTGSVIDVGSPCSTSSGCKAIPAGVSTLVELLQAIDGEQLNLEPCAGQFD